MTEIAIDPKLKIEQAIEDPLIYPEFRPYLGASTIAEKCARKLWYNFRLCSKEPITPRIQRLFGRGHREEPIIVHDLIKAGIKVHSDQAECVFGHGHIKGHIDGILENVPDAPKTPHLGEYKTANDKSFKDMVKKGLEKSKPVYHGQMIVYMNEFKLRRGLFIMVNKNDDARYYERVYEDKSKAQELKSRGIDIISSEVPLTKIGGPDWFECKYFCSHYDVCQQGGDVLKTCRSCVCADICEEGEWVCSKHDIELAFAQQQIGCGKHELLLGLQ